MTREHVFGVAGIMLVAGALLALVLVPGSNEGPRRSEEARFSLIQSVSAQTATAGQAPTCEQILSEFEADPETQRASPRRATVRAELLARVRAGVAGSGRTGSRQPRSRRQRLSVRRVPRRRRPTRKHCQRHCRSHCQRHRQRSTLRWRPAPESLRQPVRGWRSFFRPRAAHVRRQLPARVPYEAGRGLLLSSFGSEPADLT